MRSYRKLKQNWEFHRAYARGISCVASTHVLYAVKGKKNEIRLGITAGKKLGSAVKRNRAKRVVTAAFDACVQNLPSEYDFVVVARTRILKAKSTNVAATFKKQLIQQNLWVE